MFSLIGASEIIGEWVDELVAIASNQWLSIWHMVGTFYLGWIKVKNSDVAEGMSLLRTSLATYRVTRGADWRPHFAVLLAEAWEIAGQVEKAIIQVNNAL